MNLHYLKYVTVKYLTEKPVFFVLFYLISEENGPCPDETTVYGSRPEY